MKIFHRINKSLRFLGVQIKKYPNVDLRRRLALMKLHNIEMVFDVGANIGQYANELFYNNFEGEIHSFEPMNYEFQVISKAARNLNKWSVHNFALGDKTEKLEINVSQNKFSSSILTLTNVHIAAANESVIIGKEAIEVKRLDEFVKEIQVSDKNLMLKIDTQGYEYNVLLGAGDYLDQFKLIQVELSLVKLYEGEKDFQHIIDFLRKRNFKLVSIEPGFYNEFSGELLQFDGIFCRI